MPLLLREGKRELVLEEHADLNWADNELAEQGE
jgi:hypothetical protein